MLSARLTVPPMTSDAGSQRGILTVGQLVSALQRYPDDSNVEVVLPYNAGVIETASLVSCEKSEMFFEEANPLGVVQLFCPD